MTIDEINITAEMNTEEITIQKQEQEKRENIPTHGCNLRRHPNRQKAQVSMMQTGVVNFFKHIKQDTLNHMPTS